MGPVGDVGAPGPIGRLKIERRLKKGWLGTREAREMVMI
jgi:hypothetical protein